MKYKISAVSYLNSTPFIYGLENYGNISNLIELSKDSPAICANKLKTGNADIGLIPVAEYPNIPNQTIISDYCIGAVGTVKTVLLLSDVPLHNIKTILLDYQSASSNALTQVLADNFWKIKPKFQASQKGYENTINGTTAGIIIGDRTFNLPKTFNCQYDLAEEWLKYTKLPFTFAVWAANKPISAEFIKEFNAACRYGLNHIPQVLDNYSDTLSKKRLSQYLNKEISYKFDDKKKQAMKLFLSMKSKIKYS